MQNFSGAFLLEMEHDGTVALPVSEVREPSIDVEAVVEIAEAVDHERRFVTIPHEEFLSASSPDGVPGSYVQLLDELFRVVLDGHAEATTDDVERALGCPATTRRRRGTLLGPSSRRTRRIDFLHPPGRPCAVLSS